MTFPRDFRVPVDQGGPGQGQPVGGFGGNPSLDRSGHRAAVERVGKAPVLLVHGNAGAADRTTWDMLDLKRMLNGAGYPDEIVWAPSYLGPASWTTRALRPAAHEQRQRGPRVHRPRLRVPGRRRRRRDRALARLLAGLRDLPGAGEAGSPAGELHHPKRWHRVGTFVALAGAFHGLRPPSGGEWAPGGEFMTELLGESLGGGGETPYRVGQPQTPAPAPHNITYFCGIAKGDFVDASHPGTGKLAGAVNREYGRGPSVVGHERIKEDPVVFADFLPLLNTVPPAPPVTIALSPPSGGHAAPLTVALSVTPADLPVEVQATRVAKAVANGLLSVTKLESLQQTMGDGETLKLPTAGMWDLVLSAPGAVDDLQLSYWVGVRSSPQPSPPTTPHPFTGWEAGAVALGHDGDGYWSVDVPGAAVGQAYRFLLTGFSGETLWRTDPYAREMRNSNGDCVIRGSAFDWGSSGFTMPGWDDLIVYELHVGTFHGGRGRGLPEVAAKLPYLAGLGVTAVLVLPPAEFPGESSWGYNSSSIFTVETDYGGPDAFRAFVRAAHDHGIAVLVDVVYNHFGTNDSAVYLFDGWQDADHPQGIYIYDRARYDDPLGPDAPGLRPSRGPPVPARQRPHVAARLPRRRPPVRHGRPTSPASTPVGLRSTTASRCSAGSSPRSTASSRGN